MDWRSNRSLFFFVSSAVEAAFEKRERRDGRSLEKGKMRELKRLQRKRKAKKSRAAMASMEEDSRDGKKWKALTIDAGAGLKAKKWEVDSTGKLSIPFNTIFGGG